MNILSVLKYGDNMNRVSLSIIKVYNEKYSFKIQVLTFYHTQTFQQTCNSQECVDAAHIILAAMDRSAKPCEDMYQVKSQILNSTKRSTRPFSS